MKGTYFAVPDKRKAYLDQKERKESNEDYRFLANEVEAGYK